MILLNIIGKTPAIMPVVPIAATIPTLKPAKTFNIMCPAIIFANKRTDSVIGRVRNDITSIGIIKGVSHNGTPGGKNKVKK